MKNFNKLSKIISMIITVCMLIGICSVSVVFADGDIIFADPVYDYYKTVDTSGEADNTFGIYMESKYTNLQYRTTSFVTEGGNKAKYAAIAWPPTLKTREEGDGYPAQNATVTKKGSDYIVKSNTSGVKYKMPDRITPSDSQVNSGSAFDLNEALIIDFKRSVSGGVGRMMSGVVQIGKSYEKIHFLIGHASDTVGDYNGNGQVQAHVVYNDGTTTLPEGARISLVSWAGKNRYLYDGDGAALIDAPESDGRNGYIAKTLPTITAQGQSDADNFVADFVSYVSPSGLEATANSTYAGQFATTDEKITFAAYEYTLTVDPTKVVKEIIFSQTSGIGGYAVLAISGENEPEDWTDKVDEINAAIENLEAKGASSSASEVAQTMELINSAVEAGLESYVDTDKFNSLFSNGEFTENLVDAMLRGIDRNEETGEFEVTWDDTTGKFKDLDDVASVIEETGNLETCPAKEDILKAYEGMVASLTNEKEKDNNKMIERFELLKSAKTVAFQEIFEDKIIYNKTTPSIKSSIELITFDVDFSKPVDEGEFIIKDNFEVFYGSDRVDNSWITVKPKLTGEDITGAIVEVLNSQDYSKAYTLKVSKNLKGKNDELWGYQLTQEESASSPFTATVSGVALKSDNTLSGKFTLNNLSGSDFSNCVVMIMSYDAEGKCLGTIYSAGTAAKGPSEFEFSGILPEKAKNVLYYVYDSVTSMTLLTPPAEIEIPAQ